ncbi:MAG: ATP-binding protein [Cystobacterineae bacterium]|nr:ATP-binding protein [Cystobacterineae bacterium]
MLKNLVSSEALSQMVREFAELHHIGIRIFDEEGQKLADAKTDGGEFCSAVFATPSGRQTCAAVVSRLTNGPLTPDEHAPLALIETPPPGTPPPLVISCYAGLRYLLMPIVFDGDILGRVVFGPFFPEQLQPWPASLDTTNHSDWDMEQLAKLAENVERSSESKLLRILLPFSSILHLLIASGQRAFYASSMQVETTLEHARELENQNRKLLQMNERLRELDRLKSSFLATVSHELRTPLTSIIGYSEMLSDGLAGPMNMEQSEYVSTILERSQSLLGLISSMLDITQIEAGKVHMNFEPISLGELVRLSLASVRPWVAKKKITVTAHIPAHSDAVGDKERLKQVLINLLTNAIKFTLPQGKISVVLTEKEYQEELKAPGYRLWVEDTGIGIPKDQLDNVFRSFFQVDSSSTREFGGTGLGLAIVKGFVEGHGGVVRVLSDSNQGSRFTVVLPQTPPQEEMDIPHPVSILPSDDRF